MKTNIEGSFSLLFLYSSLCIPATGECLTLTPSMAGTWAERENRGGEGDLGDGSPSVGFRGEAPVGGLGDLLEGFFTARPHCSQCRPL